MRWTAWVLLITAVGSACSSRATRRSPTVRLTSTETEIADRVVREPSQHGDFYVIRTHTIADEWRVGLLGRPATDPTIVSLSLRTELGPARVHAACPAGLMIDGTIVGEVAWTRVDPRGEDRAPILYATMLLSRVAAMSAATRVAIRVCDEEIRFGPEHRAVIAEFVLRFNEELRWIAGAPEVQAVTASEEPL